MVSDRLFFRDAVRKFNRLAAEFIKLAETDIPVDLVRLRKRYIRDYELQDQAGELILRCHARGALEQLDSLVTAYLVAAYTPRQEPRPPGCHVVPVPSNLFNDVVGNNQIAVTNNEGTITDWGESTGGVLPEVLPDVFPRNRFFRRRMQLQDEEYLRDVEKVRLMHQAAACEVLAEWLQEYIQPPSDESEQKHSDDELSGASLYDFFIIYHSNDDGAARREVKIARGRKPKLQEIGKDPNDKRAFLYPIEGILKEAARLGYIDNHQKPRYRKQLQAIARPPEE